MKKNFLMVLLTLAGCDPARVYEQYHDLEKRCWTAEEKPEFSFQISDTATAYNLYASIRNDSDYPFANLYFTFRLSDTTGILQEKLVSAELFERKTGKPLGSTGIGFLFDHRIALLQNYRFQKPGMYAIRLEQFMRTDTLCGIRATGLRVERVREHERK